MCVANCRINLHSVQMRCSIREGEARIGAICTCVMAVTLDAQNVNWVTFSEVGEVVWPQWLGGLQEFTNFSSQFR